MPKNKDPWAIAYLNDSITKKFDEYFRGHANQRHCKDSFEVDVTKDPYFHPTKGRIKVLQGDGYDGQYRYSKSNTRITYIPDKPSQTVYPLAIGSATSIGYKKKSKKK